MSLRGEARSQAARCTKTPKWHFSLVAGFKQSHNQAQPYCFPCLLLGEVERAPRKGHLKWDLQPTGSDLQQVGWCWCMKWCFFAPKGGLAMWGAMVLGQQNFSWKPIQEALQLFPRDFQQQEMFLCHLSQKQTALILVFLFKFPTVCATRTCFSSSWGCAECEATGGNISISCIYTTEKLQQIFPSTSKWKPYKVVKEKRGFLFLSLWWAKKPALWEPRKDIRLDEVQVIN